MAQNAELEMHKPVNIKPAMRTNNIKYAVRDIVVIANETARSGVEMLYLNIGDPNIFDFQTPRHIIEATYEAMKANNTGYSPSSGIDEALESIGNEARRNGISNIQDVFITTGGSEAIDVALTALVDEGENVLTPSPGYPLYTALLNKLKAVENPYYLDESNGWQPDVDDISNKINDKTRAIVVINPNNPTGSVCRRETLQAIADLAIKHGLVLFSDEIYDKLLFDGRKHISIASLDPDVPAITFNGLSKSYIAPGFRIGWGIVSGNKKTMSGYIEAMNKLLRARLCANHPEQYSIKPALEGNQDHLADMLARLERRRDITTTMLNEIPGISCEKPEGAFYAFPRLDIEETDNCFVQELIKETGVVVVPGSGFGQVPGTKHFRVVFLPPEDVLEKSFTLIRKFSGKYTS